MPPGSFKKTVGKQRAVWAQAGGGVWVGGNLEHIQAVVIEAGTAVRENFAMFDDTVTKVALGIPVMTVPAGATVVRAVAMVAPASFGWNDDADSAVWAVDAVHVEEDAATRQLSIVAALAEGGTKTNLGRLAYHITIFIRGRKYIADPSLVQELEGA